MKSFFSSKQLLPHAMANISSEELTRKKQLIEDIIKTQESLERAYQGLDNALDPDLIDCYIYEVNSELKRYRFLIGQANRMHLFSEENLRYCSESVQ